MVSSYWQNERGGMFTCLEFHNGIIMDSNVASVEQLHNRIRNFRKDPKTACSGLCIIFEDISSEAVASLNQLLEIEPQFFYNHLKTSYFHRLDTQSATTVTSVLPSKTCFENLAHFRFQRVLNLENLSPLVPYELYLEGNSQRKVRRMPPISGRSMGIAESCFSILKKDLGGGTWICLMLMDSTSTAISSHSPDSRIRILQKPYRKSNPGSETRLPNSPLLRAHLSQPPPMTSSFLEEITNALLKFQWDSSSRVDIGIIELAQYPIQIILTEWTLYSLLMGRYIQLYEFSFENLKGLTSAEISNIMLDLHRWRRRSQRSLEKVQLLRFFFKQQPYQSKIIELFSEDVDFISNQIVQYRSAFESMVPTLTSMIQLIDSRRAMKEMMYVKRLTYIALVFLPLSYVASLFSMSEAFAVNSSGFETYLATAVPLLVLVLFISNLSFGRLLSRLQEFRKLV